MGGGAKPPQQSPGPVLAQRLPTAGFTGHGPSQLLPGRVSLCATMGRASCQAHTAGHGRFSSHSHLLSLQWSEKQTDLGEWPLFTRLPMFQMTSWEHPERHVKPRTAVGAPRGSWKHSGGGEVGPVLTDEANLEIGRGL